MRLLPTPYIYPLCDGSSQLHPHCSSTETPCRTVPSSAEPTLTCNLSWSPARTYTINHYVYAIILECKGRNGVPAKLRVYAASEYYADGTVCLIVALASFPANALVTATPILLDIVLVYPFPNDADSFGYQNSLLGLDYPFVFGLSTVGETEDVNNTEKVFYVRLPECVRDNNQTFVIKYVPFQPCHLRCSHEPGALPEPSYSSSITRNCPHNPSLSLLRAVSTTDGRVAIQFDCVTCNVGSTTTASINAARPQTPARHRNCFCTQVITPCIAFHVPSICIITQPYSF